MEKNKKDKDFLNDMTEEEKQKYIKSEKAYYDEYMRWWNKKKPENEDKKYLK